MFKFLRKKSKKPFSYQDIFLLAFFIALALYFIGCVVVTWIPANPLSTKQQARNREIREILAKSKLINVSPVVLNNSSSLTKSTLATLADKMPSVQSQSSQKQLAIEVFTDFECSMCSRYNEVLAQTLTDYGDKIKITLRHFPLTRVHRNALAAAEAYECAKEQGKGWEMYDQILASVARYNMEVETWRKIAVGLNLNSEQFNACLVSNKYSAVIEKDQLIGRSKGVRGTPATVINNKLILGVAAYSELKTAIDAGLQELQ